MTIIAAIELTNLPRLNAVQVLDKFVSKRSLRYARRTVIPLIPRSFTSVLVAAYFMNEVINFIFIVHIIHDRLS